MARPVTAEESVDATVAVMALMFSIVRSDPEASRTAVAEPFAPLTAATMVPELASQFTDAPPSIWIARTSTASAEAAVALMNPPST